MEDNMLRYRMCCETFAVIKELSEKLKDGSFTENVFRAFLLGELKNRLESNIENYKLKKEEIDELEFYFDSIIFHLKGERMPRVIYEIATLYKKIKF